MSLAALKRMHPLFIEQVYGKQLADGVRGVLAERKGK